MNCIFAANDYEVFVSRCDKATGSNAYYINLAYVYLTHKIVITYKKVSKVTNGISNSHFELKSVFVCEHIGYVLVWINNS